MSECQVSEPAAEKSILLVEDELLIAMAEKMTLENAGYRVFHVSDGPSAISKIQNYKEIDLVLMDINLGGEMDGTVAAQRILNLRELPLIFLSSHTEKKIIDKVEGITSYGYIVKNTGDTVLLASIRMAFRLYGANLRSQEHEQALKTSQEKTRTIFNTMGEAIFLHPLKPEGFSPFLDVNDTACSRYGYSREEFLKLTAEDISLKEFVKIHASQKHRKELLNRRDMVFESVHVTKSGEQFPVEIHSKIIQLDGQPVILASARDIRERKETQKLQEQLKKNAEAIINGMNDTAWILDFRGNILEVNRRAEEVLGYSREEIISLGLTGIDGTLEGREIEQIAGDIRLERVQSFQTLHRKKNGQVYPVEIVSTVIPYFDGEAILSVCRDMSAHNQAGEEIRRQLSEKEYLLKAVHHRIKNNIASIKALLTLRLQSINSKEARDVIKDTVSQIDCMLILYQTLLNSNSFESISVREFSESLISSIISLFPQAGGIQVEKDIDDFTIGTSLIFPLGVVIEELLTNTLKYAFSGLDTGCKIEYRLKHKDNHVLLQVTDNGRGLPEGFSIEKSGGFGLMIVEMLVRQLGGKFTLREDRGIRAKLSFPMGNET